MDTCENSKCASHGQPMYDEIDKVQSLDTVPGSPHNAEEFQKVHPCTEGLPILSPGNTRRIFGDCLRSCPFRSSASNLAA